MYEFLTYRVSDVMTNDPVVIDPGTTIAQVEEIFDTHSFNGLPVVGEDRRLLGMLTKLDVLHAFAFSAETVVPAYDRIARQPIERFMNREPVSFEPDTPLTRVLEEMVRTRYKSFPVVRDGRLQGMVAREDVLHALRTSLLKASAPAAR
jgi:CBS domain-containing protein